MPARRDQVQAYRFVTRRIVSALLSGEPETTDRPMRRLGWAVFTSAMVSVLVVAGAGVWGLVTNQGRALADAGDTVVIADDTHARYAYVDGRLHPIPNLTSAMLIFGTADPSIRDGVPRSVLDDLPPGPRIGIEGAPEELPAADEMAELPWRLCSTPPSTDRPQPRTTLVIGRELSGGAQLGERGLYVTDGRADYLMWSDRLLEVTDDVARVVLGIATVEPTPIGVPLRNAVTAGPAMDVVRPEGFSELTDIVINDQVVAIGYMYLTAGQHLIMTRTGLRPIGELTVALRTERGAAQVRDISGREAASHLDEENPDPLEPDGYPMQVPEMHAATEASPTVCAAYRGPVEEGLATTIEVFESPPPELGSRAVELMQDPAQDDTPAADLLGLPAGSAALVQQATLDGEADAEAPIFLVTPDGVRYPLGSDDARAALGYGDVEPVSVPAQLLELVPVGPLLDVEQARQSVSAPEAPEGA